MSVETDAGRVGTDDGQHLKAVIAQAWSSHAGAYDQVWGHGLRTDVERRAWLTLLESLSPAAPPPYPRRRLWHGSLSLLLAELGHAVVGLDLTEEMLAVHRHQAAERGLDVTLVQAGGGSHALQVDADHGDPPPGRAEGSKRLGLRGWVSL